MSWWKLEGRAAFHGKLLIAKNEAVGAWARMGAWCTDALTGGFVPTEIALAIAERQEVLDRLVAAKVRPGGTGLLEPVEGGYKIHDFGDYNPDADEERARREAISARRREAGQRGAAARWNGNGAKSDGKPMAIAMLPSWQTDASDPDPDPDPGSERSGSLDPDPKTETLTPQEGGTGETPAPPGSRRSPTKRVKVPKEKTAQERYLDAFVAGIADAGFRVSRPSKSDGRLLGKTCGELAPEIVGDALVSWIRNEAAAFRRAISRPEVWKGQISVFGLIAWWNAARPVQAPMHRSVGARERHGSEAYPEWDQIPEDVPYRSPPPDPPRELDAAGAARLEELKKMPMSELLRIQQTAGLPGYGGFR